MGMESDVESSPLRRMWSATNQLPSEELVDVLRTALPGCPAAVAQRMQNEGLATLEDLAGLEHQDLCELGLGMLERSRLRRALARAGPADPRGHTPCGAEGAVPPPGTPGHSAHHAAAGQSGAACLGFPRAPAAAGRGAAAPQRRPCRAGLDFSRHLDDLQSQTDWWSLVEAPAAMQLRREVEQVAESLRADRDNADFADLREQLLEKLFDLSPERLREVYEKVDRDSDGRIHKEELREAFKMCGLDGLALGKVMQAASTDVSETLQLAEFESVLTRLKLAQLLGTYGQKQSSDSVPAVSQESSCLTAVDYNVHCAKTMVLEGVHSNGTSQSAPATSGATDPKDASLLKFFFGHRNPLYPVRWAHLSLLDREKLTARDLTLLLALTIKYQLHPLSVEDVLVQCATQMERYGNHYFAAIEYFCLDGSDSGQTPVAVQGCHVTMFCAGPPHWDTLITVEQPDCSFASDWPGESARTDGNVFVGGMQGNTRWTDRLKKRLSATRSRTRERQADFLMYQVVDLCTDDLARVIKAYFARVNWLEGQLRSTNFERQQATIDRFDKEWLAEVVTMRLQLRVVSRRLRGMQRLLNRLADDKDLCRVLAGYLHDVSDHVHEALEDAGQLMETCSALRTTYEQTKEREQNHRQTSQDERMNKMLFVLTIFTAIFTPLTFFCGIYGMNFVDPEGNPTIPELLWPRGYEYFWVATIVYAISFSAGGCWMYMRLYGAPRSVKPIDQSESMAISSSASDSDSGSAHAWNCLISNWRALCGS